MMVPNSSIEQQWQIVENDGHDLNYPRHEYEFFVVCTIATGRRLGYPCHTLTEAHAKLNAIAEVLFGSQPLAVA